MTATDPSSVIRVAVAHFPPTAAAVSEVRTSTARTLLGWSVDPAAVDVCEVVVCELASNAVKASRPRDLVAIRLTATSGNVLVEVWDGSAAGPRLTSPDVFSEDGRGLLMVDALCTQWSWYRVRSGGKVVWGQIPGGLRPQMQATDVGAALPARTPLAGPEPVAPVVYRTDPPTLRRVADALRGLDDWHRPSPGPAGTKDRTATGSRHGQARPEAVRR
ncbi:MULTISPECIES: ATP-binding protein [Frankia]|uniref:ATP-binding protein n=1 Tax=Frankia TaxID=1854 RepID=UPI000461D33A|nr:MULTISPECIES: ATP-binding protein [Frankia]KDA41085.1 anti-sigma regulatory factor (Ser/Thr protein kinase) [Frankia sp. BMG5.23]